jgi:hypothetical protein
MQPSTLELIHNTSFDLLKEMLELTDQPVLTEEVTAWREKAENLIAYSEQHYKPETINFN